jgi:hypothetical protein
MNSARRAFVALVAAVVAPGARQPGPTAIHAQGAAAEAAPCPGVSEGATRDRLAAALRVVGNAETCREAAAFEQVLDLLDPLLYRRDAPAQAWYLAGRAKLGLAELEAVPRWRDHQRPGTSSAQGARRALAEALRRDPGHSAAAALLAELRRRTRGGAGSAGDLAAIRGAGATAAADTAYWLRRARSELEWNEPDSALAAVDRLVAAGGDPALAEAERARAFFTLGRIDDGAVSWFAGLEIARGSALAAYRADLAWVAREAELAAFDSLPPGLRVAWARGFWERRALADFRSVPERLAEHFTRIRQALDAFRLTDPGRDFNSAMPFRSAQDLVDDRGVIWVRHGAPDEALASDAGGGDVPCRYLSWVYRAGANAGMSVHFRPFFSLLRSDIRFCSGRADYRLVPGGEWIDHHAWWMAERDSLYAEWVAAMDGRRRVAAGRLAGLVAAEEVARLELAVSTDGQPQRFAHDLGAVVRAYALGDPARLLVAFGAPAIRLEPVARGPGGGATYTLRLRLAALPARGFPVTLDTTLVYDATRALHPDHWVLGLLELPVTPGAWEFRALLTDQRPDAGTTGWQPELEVPAPGVPSVSALVLGTPGSELRWESPAGAFPLSPLNAYRRDDEVALFVEAAGLAGAAIAEVRMRVGPADRPERSVLELRSEEPVMGGRLRVVRTIGLERLAPGAYQLEVEVRAPGGVVAARAQRFLVRR